MSSKPKSLLIVDDEKDLAEVISTITAEHFEKIYLAYDGASAIEILKNNEISLILCDILMPAMTGNTFLKNIRVLGYETPLVFLTGNSNKVLAIEALKLGAADFLEKPFEPDHLVRTLQLALEVEEHRKNLLEIQTAHPEKLDLLRCEKKLLGIKQASRTQKLSS